MDQTTSSFRDDQLFLGLEVAGWTMEHGIVVLDKYPAEMDLLCFFTMKPVRIWGSLKKLATLKQSLERLQCLFHVPREVFLLFILKKKFRGSHVNEKKIGYFLCRRECRSIWTLLLEIAQLYFPCHQLRESMQPPSSGLQSLHEVRSRTSYFLNDFK